jgi:hypothetical protein
VAISAPVIMPLPGSGADGDGGGSSGVVVMCRLSSMTGAFEISHRLEMPGGQQGGQETVNARGHVVAALPASDNAAATERFSGTTVAAAVRLLAGILPSGRDMGGGQEETPAAMGVVAAVGGEWHSGGYLSAPQQLDSCLHLGVVEPKAGARIPVAVGGFSVAIGQGQACQLPKGEAGPAAACLLGWCCAQRHVIPVPCSVM